MGSTRNTTEKALQMLRFLPRVTIGNIRPNPDSKKKPKLGRAQHGGDKHGFGNKGSGQRQNFMRLGYETGNNPFYCRFPYEPYNQGHHFRREYLPISMRRLQALLDTNRLNPSGIIDVTSICNTGLFKLKPDERQCGFQLTDEGADIFRAKINIEVQYASDEAIAAIEKNGGHVRIAYYDLRSLQALMNPKKWFEKGEAIPRRMIPPQDAMEYYGSAERRGYLANPEEISHERLVLAQKFGYELPKIEEDPAYEQLTATKDPRQIFYGLQPGWVISLKDKAIIKPKSTED